MLPEKEGFLETLQGSHTIAQPEGVVGGTHTGLNFIDCLPGQKSQLVNGNGHL